MVEKPKNKEGNFFERAEASVGMASVVFTVAWFAYGYMLMLGYVERQAEAFPIYTYANSEWLKWGGTVLWLGFGFAALMLNLALWRHLLLTKRNRDLAKISVYISVYCLVGGLSYGLLGTISQLAPSPKAYRYFRHEPQQANLRVLSTTTRKGAPKNNIRR